ncbi:Ku DNA-binding complex, Ku70 subunit [Violaceomyces palustris]|uniref:Ku DNA-binding complex, Ku70 subunit n=1 Tax=Violaceomyces palustris TaxID=1673888 RepID=A0ACD0NVP4_9BASI|nr:Ku DNA-binding complex, Ku70 subunit [Violaceomyces palustris]
MPTKKANFIDKRQLGREDEDDVDDEEEDVDWEATYQKDMVLFAIDAGKTMHRINPSSGTSNLYHALRAAKNLMEKKLISSPHDHVGIVLFNTEDTSFKSIKPGDHYSRSTELLPIRQVNVPDTFEVNSILKQNEADPGYLETLFAPSSKQMRIDHALANAGAAMSGSANAGSKRIFFITDNDDPHAESPESLSAKIVKGCMGAMTEFKRLGMKVESFFISSDEHKFRINKFYAEVFGTYDDDDDDRDDDDDDYSGLKVPKGFKSASSELQGQEARRHLWDSAVRFEELEKDVSTRETPKRVIFSIRFELGATINSSEKEKEEERLPTARGRGKKWYIGVKGYSLISRAKKGLPVKVVEDEEDGEFHEVLAHQYFTDANTEQRLPKRDVVSAFQFGSIPNLRSQVTFTAEETRKIKSLGMLPGLRLLGFKDRSELKFQDNVKHSYFIYPSDTELRGSKRVFAALLNSMVRKSKIGLGLFMPRQNVTPVFVAIMPQAEELVDGQQLQPPGMHLITLPFADDIREVPEKCQFTETATAEEVDAAKAIIERYQKKHPFNPDHYHNPALNHHYAVLKAVAFQEPLPERIEDNTIPKYDEIKKRTGHLIQAFHEVVARDERSRQVSVKTSSAVRKPTFTSDEQILSLYSAGKLGSFTLDELKAACDFYRLDKKGKKADLVERVSNHVAKALEMEMETA